MGEAPRTQYEWPLPKFSTDESTEIYSLILDYSPNQTKLMYQSCLAANGVLLEGSLNHEGRRMTLLRIL